MSEDAWIREAIDAALSEHKDAIADLASALGEVIGLLNGNDYRTARDQQTLREARALVARFAHVKPPG